MLHLQVQKLVPEATLPQKAHDTDLGWDLRSVDAVTVYPGGRVLVSTGLAIGLPPGHGALIRDRSGMASKGYAVTGGVIDEGYVGEWKVIITNLKQLSVWEQLWVFFTNAPLKVLRIEKQDKIAQFLVLPNLSSKVVEVSSLEDTSRGTGGFGSTDQGGGPYKT